jgi:hypothetical protein
VLLSVSVLVLLILLVLTPSRKASKDLTRRVSLAQAQLQILRQLTARARTCCVVLSRLAASCGQEPGPKRPEKPWGMLERGHWSYAAEVAELVSRCM